MGKYGPLSCELKKEEPRVGDGRQAHAPAALLRLRRSWLRPRKQAAVGTPADFFYGLLFRVA